MRRFVTKTVLSSFVLALVAFSGSAIALGSMSNDRAVQAQEAAKMRLEGAKLKACESRERIVNDILDRIARRGEKRLDVYNKISERVQDFYVRKGLSVSNYEELVAEVNAKKDAAQAVIDEIKANEIKFACDGTDPKGVASSFKEDLKAEIKALHDYQQSIKNLMVAVKTAISDLNQNNSDSG